MKNKILVLLLVGIFLLMLCSCGQTKTTYIPKTVNSTEEIAGEPMGQKNLYKFKGKKKDKTVIYTMSFKGNRNDIDVNNVPDKVFASMLTDGKKGKTNELVLTELNYQYKTPEWSAYYFHNILFAFSDAVLNGKVDTFLIQEKGSKPFFKGTVKLNSRNLPKEVNTTLIVPPSKDKKENSGIDRTQYDFAYNAKGNITRVKFYEKATWSDKAGADITVSYQGDGETIQQISKAEHNTNVYGDNYFVYQPNYENGQLTQMIVIQDTTQPVRSKKDDIEALDYHFSDGIYTGFKGAHSEQLDSDNSVTDYEYKKNHIHSLEVTEIPRGDKRTYSYMKI